MVLVFNVPPRCPSNFSGRTSGDDLKYEMPVCWNWQTRRTQNPLMATSCGFDPRHRHHTSKARNPLKWLGLRAFLCFARLYTALLHHQICATITKILKASFLHIVLLDISIVAMARASIRSILVLRRLKLFRYRLVCIYFCSFKCR